MGITVLKNQERIKRNFGFAVGLILFFQLIVFTAGKGGGRSGGGKSSSGRSRGYYGSGYRGGNGGGYGNGSLSGGQVLLIIFGSLGVILLICYCCFVCSNENKTEKLNEKERMEMTHV